MTNVAEPTPSSELLYARLDGIVSRAFREKSIFFSGLGAGSAGVEMIARCGPRKITGIDMQNVEPANIARTAYTWDDARRGRPKAEALAERLRAVNPLLEIDLRAGDITTLDPGAFDSLLDVDLLVAGTDSFPAQALMNEEAVRRRIPAVFIGLHARAAGGRVIWIVPGETGCYRCAAPERYKEPKAVQELHAEPACLVDSLLIEVVAMRVVLALLERGQPSVMGRFYEAMAGRNEIVVRSDPSYEWGGQLWDAALAGLPQDAQAGLRDMTCAADSLWFRAERDPNCPVCAGVGARGRTA